MTDSPEVKAAQAKLDQAVRDYVNEMRQAGDAIINEEAVMSGYIMLIEGQHWDEEGVSRTSMGRVFDGGDMPISRAVGLLVLASDALRGIGDPDD